MELELKKYFYKKRINHEEEIMKQENLKNAHIYCIINNINSQKYGILLEKYIIKKYGFIKNKSKNTNGDCFKNGKNYD